MEQLKGNEIEVSPYPRGKIKKLIMEIQYPDNSSIVAYYDEEWIQKTGAIIFHESCMTAEQRDSFRGSDKWDLNPTFLRKKRGDDIGNNKCLDNGGDCDHCCYCREHQQR